MNTSKNNIIKLTIIVLFLIFVSVFIYFYKISSNESNKTESQLQKMGKFGSSLGFAYDIAVFDSLIIIIDKKPISNNKFIQVFNSEGKPLYNFGEQGQGPNEIVSPKKIDFEPSSKTFFWIYDLIQYRLTKFSIYGDSTGEFITLKEGMPYSPVILDENKIISPGFALTSNFLGCYDSSGHLIKEIGEIPPGKKENTPIPVHLVAYQSKVRKSFDCSKIIVAPLFTNSIEIYQADGTLLKRFYYGSKFLPIYETVGVGEHPVMSLNDKKTNVGFLDICLTKDKIYALYSGRSLNEYKDRASFGNTIIVFDLDGNLLRTYNTKEEIYLIAVNKEESTLYGAQEDENEPILIYSLK
ncbi:MAG: BF3164 family lipoprotein [Ignavibacteriaceae bacterium]